jgi:hypothetical protein
LTDGPGKSEAIDLLVVIVISVLFSMWVEIKAIGPAGVVLVWL